jgi:hypothetical protein
MPLPYIAEAIEKKKITGFGSKSTTFAFQEKCFLRNA